MTATKARIGYGTTFAIGDGATPEVFTPVAEVKSLKGLKYKKDQVEATHLTSPGGFKEFIDGLKDFDAISGTYNYEAGGASETALLAAYNSATRKNYKITFPNGATWVFLGVMTECAPGDVDVDKIMEGSFVIKPSGAATITAAP